jgi:hypothetical protein
MQWLQPVAMGEHCSIIFQVKCTLHDMRHKVSAKCSLGDMVPESQNSGVREDGHCLVTAW